MRKYETESPTAGKVEPIYCRTFLKPFQPLETLDLLNIPKLNPGEFSFSIVICIRNPLFKGQQRNRPATLEECVN